MPPFHRVNIPLFKGMRKIISNTATPTIHIISELITLGETSSGFRIAVMPRIENTLKILEPMMLPMEMSISFLMEAAREVANSGTLVPKATTVRPITKGEILNVAASRAAPRTSNSPPKTSTIRPAMISAYAHQDPFNVPILPSRLFSSFAENGISSCKSDANIPQFIKLSPEDRQTS